jgi:hypothetical protein
VIRWTTPSAERSSPTRLRASGQTGYKRASVYTTLITLFTRTNFYAHIVYIKSHTNFHSDALRHPRRTDNSMWFNIQNTSIKMVLIKSVTEYDARYIIYQERTFKYPDTHTKHFTLQWYIIWWLASALNVGYQQCFIQEIVPK